MEAQIAACRIGAQRYLELIERYGLETVNDAYADLLDYSERLMRAAIAELPDGDYSATTYIDGFLDDPNPRKKHLPIELGASRRRTEYWRCHCQDECYRGERRSQETSLCAAKIASSGRGGALRVPWPKALGQV